MEMALHKFCCCYYYYNDFSYKKCWLQGLFPHRTQLFNIPFGWPLTSEEWWAPYCCLFHALEMYSYSLSFHMTTFALFLSWENPINCSSIVFNYRNTSFVIKFKPFPALTDNTIQQFQISKPYKKSLWASGI